jgi:hypothetical protein
MNELKVLNKYEQQENQFYQEGKTHDGGGYDNTCVYAKLEYNGNEYNYKELDYNTGDFGDDHSIYIEDENGNLLFDSHYYRDKDEDEFHFFIDKNVIDEDFYKQLQENNLFNKDIPYSETLDFNFKKDFAKMCQYEKDTDLCQCKFHMQNKTVKSDFMFKSNNDVYFAKIKDTPLQGTRFLDLYKYNEKNETLENVLSYREKHDYEKDSTVRFVIDGNSKEFNKELFLEIRKKFEIDLFDESLFKNANDIEVVYDEKSDRNCDLCGIKYNGKEYSLTDFHNKEKHEIKIRSGKDEVFKYEFDEKTRESKLEIDKEKFTEETYDAIMKNKMTKEMMPATLVYTHIRYDELDNLANQNQNQNNKIINDDLER